jgi:hypothetical protein
MGKEFKFELGAKVTIAISGEAGEVKGRAEYLASENLYEVLFKAADGRACKSWWSEAELSA